MELQRLDELSDDHVDDLHRLYRKEWWTDERERDDLVRMLDGCDEVVAFVGRDSGELVAFARVLADVEHFELYCLAGTTGFYERWGFTDDLDDLRLTRRS